MTKEEMESIEKLKKSSGYALWEHCKAFIEKQKITCPEAIYQSDRVIENAYEFIEGVCDIVGYLESQPGEE